MLLDSRQELERLVDTQRERIRQLEELLVPSSTLVPQEWMLTTKEARVFSHLTTRQIASKRTIMQALYFDQHSDDEPQEKIVDVFVCKMRKKLKPYGVQIETIWGQGYSLVDREQYAHLPVPRPPADLRSLLGALGEYIERGQIDQARTSVAELLQMVGEAA
jgi:two-component system cell cycle response regulator CtrA